MNLIYDEGVELDKQTKLVEDFLNEEFGAEKLALLQQNRALYFAIIEQLQAELEVNMTMSALYEKQMELATKKMELENERLNFYADEKTDFQTLEAWRNQLTELEKQLVINDKKLQDSQVIDDEKEKLQDNFFTVQQRMKVQDYGNLEKLLKPKENESYVSEFKKRLAQKIKTMVPKQQSCRVTYDHVCFLIDKELRNLMKIKKASELLLHEINVNERVDVCQHDKFKEKIVACENCLAGAHISLNKYLETMQQFNDEPLVDEITATMHHDNEMIFNGYRTLQEVLQNNVSDIRLDEIIYCKDYKLAEIDEYINQPNPYGSNKNDSPYLWREAIASLLHDFEQEVAKYQTKIEETDLAVDKGKGM